MGFGSRVRAWRRSGSLLVAGVLVVALVGVIVLLWPRAAILHETIDVDGARREYRLVVPRSVAGKLNVPVMFALHGANDTVDFMAEHTGLDALASEHGGDPRRIYLLGVSQGGAAANLLTAMCSERLAATVVGCGWLPDPLGEAPLETASKCPLLFIVGSRDRQVPPEFVRVGHDAFERAGHPVEFRVIEGFGHGWPRAENERVWEFLKGKRLPEAAE